MKGEPEKGSTASALWVSHALDPSLPTPLEHLLSAKTTEMKIKHFDTS